MTNGLRNSRSDSSRGTVLTIEVITCPACATEAFLFGRFLTLVGVGHLVGKGCQLADKARFSQLLGALMDRIEINLGPKLKTNVRNFCHSD